MRGTLAILWISYCFVHSLLADDRVKERLQKKMGTLSRFYRILYNLLALILLIPPLAVERILDRPVVGASLLLFSVRIIFFIFSAALFWGGARSYDMREFLGISQAWGEEKRAPLKREGVLSLVRHPWYLAGLLFLWSRRLTEGTLITNVLLSLYLVVGALLEERKLLRAYGEEYERYRKEVPMLIPRPGDLASLLRKLIRTGR